MMRMVEYPQIVQHVTDCQKMMFAGSVNSMRIAQTRTEKIMDLFLNHFSWLTERWHKSFTDFAENYYRNVEELTKSADAGLKKINPSNN